MNTTITKERLKDWSACADGYRWFLENYPSGGQFPAVYKSLIKDKRGDDADWLISKALDGMDTSERVKQITLISGAVTEEIEASVKNGAEAATTGYGANAATTGNWANAATTGNWANAATTGDRANAATTGHRANAATTGNWANAATTGNWANAATTGYGANAATTGYGANAATTGDRANAATTGVGAVATSLGSEAKAKAGAGGAIVLAHRASDGALLGVKASMVGDNGIKPDVWYVLDEAGNFKESE